MKMKEVCRRTGLTEKAVRLYVRQGLVSPQVTEGVHTNAYTFTEEDITRLRDIAALRGAGFALADIGRMQRSPGDIPALLEERRALLAEDIRAKQSVAAALDRLALPAQGDAARLADALRPAVRPTASPPPAPNERRALWPVVVLGALLALAALGTAFSQNLAVHLTLLCLAAVLAPVLGATALGMAVRYARAPARAARLPVQVEARVASVARCAGFDAGTAAIGTVDGAMAGGRAPGQGGIWQIALLFWNELRPDNWRPVLQYELAGRTVAGTLPYGGLRRDFAVGRIIPCGVDPKAPTRLLPRRAPWLRRKAAAYAALGALLIALTPVVWGGLGRMVG